MYKRLLNFLVFVFLLSSSTIIGQSKTVSGTISDQNGVALPGANVILEGTTNGVSSDFDGKYTIELSSDGILVYSMLGFAEQKISSAGQTTINVTMLQSTENLEEIVVTAFGVKRKTRSLGYAVSEVKGDQLVESRTVNIGNALTGKVAGVVVSKPSTGPGGTSNVIIRGGSSLGNNDQPLYVINGVPMDNTNQGAAGTWGGSDGGDGLSSINPDDIQDISVLKGNSAAALYGSRAANGVILITTKSGKARKGIGVTFNSNVLFDRAIDHTDFQKEYGYGSNGEKPNNQSAALQTGGNSWGARLDGSPVVQFDGEERPYSDTGESLTDFFDTGYTITNTLGLSGGNEQHTYRFSASNLSNAGLVPNSGFDKNQFTANISGKYGKLSTQVSATYSQEERKNSPRTSDSPGNANFTAFLKPSAISFNTLRGTTDKLGAREDGTELQHQGNVFAQNPYWAAYQWLRLDDRSRIFGNASLRYDVTDWLYVQGRLGMDLTTSQFNSSEAYGTAFKPLGDYNVTNRTIKENNTDLLIGFNKNFGDFGVDVLLGGNIRRYSDESARIGGNDLSIPFFHSVNNVKNQTYEYKFSELGTNSIFGQANFSYKNLLFLNVTGREDTFSTLSPDNNKLFYPSVGMSFVLSDAIELPSYVSFAKLRGAWSQVGGGAPDPYLLNVTYKLGNVGHNGAVIGEVNTKDNSIPNSALKPYTSTEVEVGVDLKFLDGRLGLDFSYYDRKTTDDILRTGVSRASGFERTTVNVGELSNKGIELLISGTPIKNDNFQWDVSFNMANNRSKVIDLGLDTEGNPIPFLNREDARTLQERIRHDLGGPLGVIAGYRHQTINGEKVYTANGLPVRGDFEVLAEGRHPFSAGLSNSFKYKNFNLNFLIDIRSGGSLVSGTNVRAYQFGLHKGTLPGRDGGLTVSGVDESGSPLTVNIPAEDVDDYYSRYASITENFVYDASFGKLRELSLGYAFPKSLLNNTFIESLNVSLVGRNLWLLWSNVPNVDPESGYSSNTGAQGLEHFAVPTTSSYGFNISARF